MPVTTNPIQKPMFPCKCNFCGRDFEYQKPDGTICRSCWYGGKAHEANLSTTIAALREINANAGVTHTGGGCFALEVPINLDQWEEEKFCRLLATEAYLDEATGEWEYDAALPEEDTEATRWALGVEDYDHGNDSGTMLGVGLDLDALVRAVEKYVDANTDTEARRLYLTIKAEWPSWSGKFTDLHEFCDANEYLSEAVERGGFSEANRLIADIERVAAAMVGTGEVSE